ncbi:MAG TPA: transposase [Gaiellaceae bacterium]
MGRPPRPTAAGIYHVGTKAPTGLPFFHAIEDYYVFMAYLSSAILFERLTCLAFCLMTTHYHLLFDAPDGAIPRAMKQLNWRYARSVNERLGGRGHVVGSRYFCVPVSDTDQLLAEFKYIARNPVKAGLCDAPEDWRWSSYAGAVGLESEFGFVDSRLVVAAIGGKLESLRAYVDGV